ncbi:hypothetical protein [Aurantiacibacter sp. MUD61]|uniref:hypothetical protein n=1 Tax=Aurantiacibacter sp. MUD61 TaxID=3009083 RepID=UPI0022F079F4|nr:hypothetical protein [Aurantiacibacter sp. MUD61]
MTTKSPADQSNRDTLPPPPQQIDPPQIAQSVTQMHQVGVRAENAPQVRRGPQHKQSTRARHADGSLANGFVK